MKKQVRIISFILSLALVFNFLHPAIVSANGTYNKFNKEFIINIVNSCGKSTKYVDLNDYKSYDPEIFNDDGGNDSAGIFTEVSNSNGIREYLFKDGVNESRLAIDVQGNMYLNGSPIKITQLEEENHQFFGGEVTPYAHRVFHWKSLPKGISDQDLPRHSGMYSRTVSFGENLIKDIAEGAFFAIVGSAVALALGLTGNVAGILGLVSGGIYTAIIKENPKSNALGIKGAKRSGVNVGGYLLIEKIYTEFYAYRNFTSYLGNSVFYRGFDD